MDPALATVEPQGQRIGTLLPLPPTSSFASRKTFEVAMKILSNWRSDRNLIAYALRQIDNGVTRSLQPFSPKTQSNDGSNRRLGGEDTFVPMPDEKEKDSIQRLAEDFLTGGQSSMPKNVNASPYHDVTELLISQDFFCLIMDKLLDDFGLRPEVGIDALHEVLDDVTQMESGIFEPDLDCWNLIQTYNKYYRYINLPAVVPSPPPLVPWKDLKLFVTKRAFVAWMLQAAHPHPDKRFGVFDRNHDKVAQPFISRPADPRNPEAGPLGWSSLFHSTELPKVCTRDARECICVAHSKRRLKAREYVLKNGDVALFRQYHVYQRPADELQAQIGGAGGSHQMAEFSSGANVESSGSDMGILASDSGLHGALQPRQGVIIDLDAFYAGLGSAINAIQPIQMSTVQPSHPVDHGYDRIFASSPSKLAEPQPRASSSLIGVSGHSFNVPASTSARTRGSPSKSERGASPSKSPLRPRPYPTHQDAMLLKRTPQLAFQTSPVPLADLAPPLDVSVWVPQIQSQQQTLTETEQPTSLYTQNPASAPVAPQVPCASYADAGSIEIPSYNTYLYDFISPSIAGPSSGPAQGAIALDATLHSTDSAPQAWETYLESYSDARVGEDDAAGYLTPDPSSSLGQTD